MNRTLVLQLKPTPEQAAILRRTLDEHTACFNVVAREGFTSQCCNSIELHKRTYYPLRRQYPDLPAQLVCAARVKATEAVTSALTWKAKQEREYPQKVTRAQMRGKPLPTFKPVKCPQSAMSPIRYDQRSYWLRWDTNTCSLATVAGRVALTFSVPAHLEQYAGSKTCSADLCYRKGRYWLHVVVSIPAPVVAPSPEVIGVDLGMTHPAVTSKRQFLGERRWREQEQRLFRLRRKLQQKGTKSAKRHLKKLSGQLFRQRRDHDHVLSKRLVHHTTPGSTLVLENLKHIRATSKISGGKGKQRQTKRHFHAWSFAQLFGFVAYKAAWMGVRVEKIDPRQTSQTCSRCGQHHRSNRRSQSCFQCKHCGYSLHADLNAAYNIRNKYVASLASRGTTSTGGPASSGLLSQPDVGLGTSPEL